MLGGILDGLTPRQEYLPCGRRLVGGENAHLARGEALAGGEEIGAVLGLAEPEEIERIRLAHDQRLRGIAEGPAEDAVRTMGGVVAEEEQRAIVRGPLEAVAHAVDRVRQQPAGSQVLDADRVPLRPRGVLAVSEKAAVGADLPERHAGVAVAL